MIIMKKTLLVALVSLVIAGCNKTIKDDDLKVIGDIKLGISKDEFVSYSKINDNNISMNEYYSKNHFFGNEHQTKIVSISTSLFDLPQYKSNPESKHLGLIIPIFQPSTDYLVGITVLLAYSNTATVNFSTSLNKAGINQNVNTRFVSDVLSLIERKYGKGISKASTPYDKMFDISQGKFDEFNLGPVKGGEIFTWENDVLKVTFFEGAKDVQPLSYSLNDKTYWLSFDEEHYRKGIASGDKIECYYGPYIKYELKDNVIEKLKLNIPKL